ncbi:MAG: NFACT RNA binding domain-containing protein [Candidatus Pacearchaeota archaeon]|nr:NFACT RNA binding domain-containing protein [Candidatus Pacearchaeota archaeon]
MKEIKFRERISRAGNLILAGKDSKSNEKLVKQIQKDEEVFHTEARGSPFVNIKGKPDKGDIKEAAIFCAIYSQDWKKNFNDVIVHRFKGKDIFKEKNMKEGTFGVKKIKKIKVKKSDIEGFIL